MYFYWLLKFNNNFIIQYADFDNLSYAQIPYIYFTFPIAMSKMIYAHYAFGRSSIDAMVNSNYNFTSICDMFNGTSCHILFRDGVGRNSQDSGFAIWLGII